METDNWTDVMNFLTEQDAVLLLDPTAKCFVDDAEEEDVYFIRAKGWDTEDAPAKTMIGAWKIATERLMDLFA